jgi:anthranilate 1,2-dioxygenase (deaminating, decarboxylating) small subunit
MMSDLQHRLEQFFYRKAELCDRRDWDAYLDMFDESAEFHIPQWDSEHVFTTDPKREMSMIYYANRAGLEDRVYRIRTGKSAASSPMPRTLHLINNVRITENNAAQLEVKTNWVTHHYRFGIAECFFGEATYCLKPVGDSWKITRKHVVLLNDQINAVLDFYHV